MTNELGSSLEVLGSAVAGRRISVTVADRSRPTTDGKTITLAADGDLRQQVLAAAALIAVGTLDLADASQVLRSRPLAQRYVAIEASRATHWARASLPSIGAHIASGVPAAVTTSAQESLALARRDRRMTPVPSIWATIATKAIRRFPSVDDAAASGDRTGAAPATDLRPRTGGRDGRAPRTIRRRRSSRSQANRAAVTTAAFAHGRALDSPDRQWTRPTPVELVAGASDTATTMLPEWDRHRQAYRTDWCQVRLSVPEPAPTALAEIDTRHLGDLHRALAPLAMGRRRVPRQQTGSEIDFDAAVLARIDRRTGGRIDDLLHIDQLRRARDLTVLVLWDTSESTSAAAPDGRRIHDHQRDAALTIATALHDLGERVGCIAFRSRGRHHVELLRVLDLGAPVDSAARRRFAGISPARSTRLGAAIRASTDHLTADAGTPHRVLVVLSDGIAFDDGYEGSYAAGDAERAIHEARASGVGCLCLTLGSSDPDDTLHRVFGAAAHARATTFAPLVPRLADLLVTALASAERSRRDHEVLDRA